MSELGREIAAAVQPDWDELRAESVWAGVQPRRRRQIAGRVAIACVAAAAVGGFVMQRPRVTEHVASPAVPVMVAEAAEPGAEQMAASETVPVATTAPREVERFERVPATRRLDAHEQWYAIHGGRAGTQRTDATFETLELSSPADRVTALLHTADVMRLAHQPADAIAPLRRIVADHADDPRAALAAFTLGRVLLDELGKPGEAAAAFADAIRLAPNGELAEDALARRVEALARAGNAVEARRLAEQYVQQFPHGRRLRAVRSAGGLP